jgi:hypothetical protein
VLVRVGVARGGVVRRLDLVALVTVVTGMTLVTFMTLVTLVTFMPRVALVTGVPRVALVALMPLVPRVTGVPCVSGVGVDGCAGRRRPTREREVREGPPVVSHRLEPRGGSERALREGRMGRVERRGGPLGAAERADERADEREEEAGEQRARRMAGAA